MSELTVKQIHYRRQFLAPETSRYDDGTCQSYVSLDYVKDDETPFIEAEIRISDGRNTCYFDSTHYDEDRYEEYLAQIDVLLQQMIDYRQAYAEALAIVRRQGVTLGAAASVVLSVNGSDVSFSRL